MDKVFEKFETEIRRGVMQLAIVCIMNKEKYGYEIIKNLNDAGLKVEEGTLYPILRRLESAEILSSQWETSGPRPRKYYKITEYGKKVRKKWLKAFKETNKTIKSLEKDITGE